MKRMWYLLLLVLVGGFGCNVFDMNEIYIDNPTAENINVVVGENSYDILPYSHEISSVKSGSYNVECKVNGDSVIYSNKIAIGESGILNPMQAIYIIWKDVYADDNINASTDIPSEELNLQENVEVNNKNYNDVDFTVFEGDIFIEKNWEYNLDESLPETLPTSSDYLIKSKVYRVDDLEEEWGYYGEYEIEPNGNVDIERIIDSIQQLIDSSALIIQ